MKRKTLTLCLLLVLRQAFATVHYVNANGANPVSPFLTWATAATGIQDAVDAASAGDEVVVTNGVYATGGRAVFGLMTNRVAVTNALAVHSVNGAQVTIIQGYQLPGSTNGDGAIRCAFLGANSALYGFTLTGGATRGSGDAQQERCGGGLWASGAVVSNCVVSGNSAHNDGGGAMFGTFNYCSFTNNTTANFATNGGGAATACTLNSCTLAGNRSPNGGGAFQSTLNNCLLTSNSATNGGGAYASAMTNCTVTGNSAGSGGGADQGTLYNCLFTGNSATNGGATYSAFTLKCTIRSNSATNGGGTYLGTAVNSTLATNSASNGGGANQGLLLYCSLTGNSATNSGGGAFGAALNSCLLAGNLATNSGGGGVYTGTLTNCTLTGNIALTGGGANSATLKNSIVYSNRATVGVEYYSSTLDYCCTTPQPGGGAGNLNADPLFMDFIAGDYHLKTNSPCINTGNNGFLLSSTDLDGNPRVSGGIVDIGAYEFQGSVAPFIVSQPGNQTATAGSNATFSVNASGTLPLSYQWSQNGSVLTGATNSSLTLTNVQLSQSGYTYFVVVTNVAGSITSSDAILTVNPAPPPPTAGTHYVDVNSATPVAPYTNWATAAITIQDAIDVAVAGDDIVVTNGIYATGFRKDYNAVDNRVLVDRPVAVRSVNGPQFTVIQGFRSPLVYTNNIRCAYLTNGASLSGFCLTNGGANLAAAGGGLYCESQSVLVSNCIVLANWTQGGAGGVYQGTLYDCTIAGNSATNQAAGGALFSTLVNCVLSTNTANGSGGADSCNLMNCIITGNSAALYGGGLTHCAATNCLIAGNWSGASGGGAYGGNLYNCTIVGNSATNSGGGGWGFDSFHIHDNCNLYNSIIYSNLAAMNPECECTQYDCCTPSNSGIGNGNIPGPPLFVDQAGGNFRLQSASPCIDAGDNSFNASSTDLDGNPRISRGVIDIGAYEFPFGPPVLRIARSGQNVTLAWPLWASNYALVEYSGVNVSSVQWTNTQGTVSVSNGENALTIQPSGSARFFRLHKP